MTTEQHADEDAGSFSTLGSDEKRRLGIVLTIGLVGGILLGVLLSGFVLDGTSFIENPFTLPIYR